RLRLGLEIEGLTADHAAGTGRAKQLERDLAPARRRQIQRGEPTRKDAGGQGDHLVAGAGRAGDIEGTMGGRAAATQVVVLHAREVVVHEQVRVNDFDGRGKLGDAVG